MFSLVDFYVHSSSLISLISKQIIGCHLNSYNYLIFTLCTCRFWYWTSVSIPDHPLILVVIKFHAHTLCVQTHLKSSGQTVSNYINVNTLAVQKFGSCFTARSATHIPQTCWGSLAFWISPLHFWFLWDGFPLRHVATIEPPAPVQS